MVGIFDDAASFYTDGYLKRQIAIPQKEISKFTFSKKDLMGPLAPSATASANDSASGPGRYEPGRRGQANGTKFC